MEDNNAIEITARAIYDALQKTDPNAFMEDFSMEWPITVDGRFQLRALAAFLLINLNGQLARTPFPPAQTQPNKS